jgi:hypothetical protein
LINDIYLLQNKFGKPTVAGDRLAITIIKEKEVQSRIEKKINK